MAKETVNEKEEKGGQDNPAPAFDSGDNADLLLAATYEISLISKNLLEYISENDGEFGIMATFARGQLLRIQALSDVIHGAIEPDVAGGDEPENLREKIFG